MILPLTEFNSETGIIIKYKAFDRVPLFKALIVLAENFVGFGSK